MRHRVRVAPIPTWVDAERLLGPGPWEWTPVEGGLEAAAQLETGAAADLKARLRNVGLGGRALETEIAPPIGRRPMRAALADDARRRRETTPGFTRRGTRLDDEGRVSLSPEDLALATARRFAGASVVDAGCGAGGDAIAFARVGCTVTAIEQDPLRVEMAAHNAAVYGVADRIRFVHGDAAVEAAGRSADVLFVDPPWGVAWDRGRTTVHDVPHLGALLEVFARGGYARLVAKVPPSFDPETVEGARAEAVFGEAPGDFRRVKFVLLTVERPA